jgi:kynurenine formamidase
VESLSEALADGSMRAVDLSHVLSERTPMIELPEPYANAPGFTLTSLSRYDDAGPAWSWNAFAGSEHMGTHFDAPVHWVTGQGGEDVSTIPPANLMGPAVVLDRRQAVAANPDYLLTVDDVRAFEEDTGLPQNGWLLYRTGWASRHDDRAAFLGGNGEGPHWPGVSTECAKYIAQTPLRGFGTEQVGTDAGIAYSFDPPFPMHHFLLGSGKYGLASLANLDSLPVSGAFLIPAPLRIEGGSGSPCRVIALVPA